MAAWPEYSFPFFEEPVTNLTLTGIVDLPASNAVYLGVAWPSNAMFPYSLLDVFAAHDLDVGNWGLVGTVAVDTNQTSATIEVPYSRLPADRSDRMFFRLGTVVDTDGDGLTDAFERMVTRTDPLLSDSDQDGLSDGDEFYWGLDPNNCDSDEDELGDPEEHGQINVLPCLEWYDLSHCLPRFGNAPSAGLQGYFGASLSVSLPSGVNLCGVDCVSALMFDNGYVSLSAPGDFDGWVFPEIPTDLAYAFNNGSFLVAPYWCSSLMAQYGNTNSYLRAGHIDDRGVTVLEFHDLRMGYYSTEGATFQVIIPDGTGSVVRVSYLSSDFTMDGSYAVAGVQNKRSVTTNGYYNLTWNFKANGPLMPMSTVEYRLGLGTNAMLSDTDGDGLADAYELNVSHTDPLVMDTDGDGIVDGDEVALGTNPLAGDSDHDGMPDGWEIGFAGLNPAQDDANDDLDGDGLANLLECQLGTDPTNPDTDGDGLVDGIENMLGTNLLIRDSDGDGLNDGDEFAIGANPLSSDSDCDGMNDDWETRYGICPTNAADAFLDIDNDNVCNVEEYMLHTNPLSADTDFDGLNDGDEIIRGTNPFRADTDLDGLNDGEEMSLGTNPLQPDSDNDGLNDGWECQYSYVGFAPMFNNSLTNSMSYVASCEPNADPDGDGLTNREECEWGTNPSGEDSDGDGVADGWDTDGDGVSDGVETGQVAPMSASGLFMSIQSSGSDPNDASDLGLPGSRVPQVFYFGDHSPSHSEKYCLVVKPVSGPGDEPSTFHWLNAEYGECETRTAMLKPGWDYEVSLMWSACKFTGEDYPDYDYTLSMVDCPEGVTLDDPRQLFGIYDWSVSFDGDGKTALLHVQRGEGTSVPPVDPGEEEEPPAADEPSTMPSLSVSFDKPVIIFEDEYRNTVDGEPVKRQSTTAILTIRASGGLRSATLNLNKLKLGKILDEDGLPIVLEGVKHLQPGETYRKKVVCKGFTPSSTSDDKVVVTGTLKADGVDESLVSTAEILVVKAELETSDIARENPSKNRHMFAYSERVVCKMLPDGIGTWTGNDTEIDDDVFYCPWTSNVYKVSAAYNGVSLDIPFTVVEPIIVCLNCELSPLVAGTNGLAGLVGMKLDLYVGPRTVSFDRVRFREHPETVDLIPPTGYFLQMPGVLPLSHGPGASDFRWGIVHSYDGSWMADYAQMPKVCPCLSGTSAWSKGKMTWKIPIDYGDLLGRKSFRLKNNPTDQVYEMESNGTLTIRKYRHSVRRSVDDRVWLDGTEIVPWWR